MTETKHIVWSNIDLDLDDWYDDLHEQYPALGEEGLRDTGKVVMYVEGSEKSPNDN